MRDVPWWGVVSAAAARLRWSAGGRWRPACNPGSIPVADTVSALAAIGATDRWVMTLTFVVVGLCYVATALALRPARRPGRVLLLVGAVSGMLVAANPEGSGGFGSVPRFVLAATGFALLTIWPLWASRRDPAVPWALRPGAAAAAVAVQFALLAWFGAELITAAGQAGLAERIMGAAQAAWPLTVVLSVVLSARTATPEPRLAEVNQTKAA